MKSRIVSTNRSKAVDFAGEVRKFLFDCFGLAVMGMVILVPATAHGQFVPNAKNNPLCQKLGTQIQGSSGMQMYCFGPQSNGAASPAVRLESGLTTTPFSPQKKRRL